MTVQQLTTGTTALAGAAFLLAAVWHERRMHWHRQPGVGYAAATFRRDGGWRRADLFTAAGLAAQRRASTCGVAGAALLLASLALWVGARQPLTSRQPAPLPHPAMLEQRTVGRIVMRPGG